MKKIILDIEVYKNYFLCSMMNIETESVRTFEMYEGQDLDVEMIRKIMMSYQTITFNGINYDFPILSLALSGAGTEKLKKASDEIIRDGLKPWHIAQKYNIEIPSEWDHVDIFEVAPGRVGLKTYGARIHSMKLQDLPIEPDAEITETDRELLRQYCVNDLRTTLDLYKKLGQRIELREKMSDEYGVDLRSKSDAQIAEAVIKQEVEAVNRRKVNRKNFTVGESFFYQVPDFIGFSSDYLKSLLREIAEAEFVIAQTGKVITPNVLKRTVSLGTSKYQLGIGGMHSTEKSISHQSTKTMKVIDWDVASYYPSIILRLGLHPEGMGKAFSSVYKSIVDRRLAAKKASDKVADGTLKIVINGSFGKFGSPYSVLYSPNLLIQTTVTGQLSLLMLIEMLEVVGIKVVSANTDGIVTLCPTDREDVMQRMIKRWEQRTGFVMESTHYKSIFSRDVNNYIAVKANGGTKLKGVYAESGLSKNPSADICTEAVIAYLEKGSDIADVICNCEDVKKFLMIRSVTGGAVDSDGEYLGRVARWYYSTRSKGPITYKINGNKVPKSDGAVPYMLLGSLPEDIDYLKYIDDAYAILKEVGHA